MDGNLQESADIGLMEAIADTYEEKAVMLNNVISDMTQVYVDAVLASADASVLEEIQDFIIDTQESSTTCQDTADSLNENATVLKS